MANVSRQIDNAINLLAERRVVFSAKDVAEYTSLEGLEDTIDGALRAHSANRTILSLDEHGSRATFDCRYTKKLVAEKWWVDQTLRWTVAGLDYLTAPQLAHTISRTFLPFGGTSWEAPPRNLLEAGRRWAMVDDGCVSGTFVSPWASVLRSNPQFMMQFRSLFTFGPSSSWLEGLFDDTFARDNWNRTLDTTLFSWHDDSPINIAIEQALERLPERGANIIRLRLGLETGHRMTLEQVGEQYGVTRERVRQIEKKTQDRLRLSSYRRYLWLGFAAGFIRSGGSMVIPESSMTPQFRLLSECIGLSTINIHELEVHIMGADADLADYRKTLYEIDAYSGSKNGQPHIPTVDALQFLSNKDGTRLNAAEEAYYSMQIHKTRPRMIREALRSLGRAAHYEEIAEECNRLFPERQKSTHNWHAALSESSSEALGIVWIGAKGMYGLKEHGYSRPDTDLFDSAAQIVEMRFAESQRPVSVDYVIAELSKQRRELKRNSVMMALSFNDKLRAVEGNHYAPKTHVAGKPKDAPRTSYDIDAAFSAFTGHEEPN